MFGKTQSASIEFGAGPRKPGRTARRLPDLPQYYYHNNFCELLEFIDRRYAGCLDEQSRLFIDEFSSLPLPAQRAFVRLTGRKGIVFNQRKLAYPEIPKLGRQFEILHHSGFVRPVDKPVYSDFLTLLTKPELIAFIDSAQAELDYKKSWKKPELVNLALAYIPFDESMIGEHFIVQDRADPLRYLLYLYFGKIQDNLQNFTMRDLGLIKTPDFKDDYQARFEDLPTARTAFFYADAIHRFRYGTEEDITRLIDTIDDHPEPQCDISASGRDRLIQKLGGLSERMEDIDTALSLYQRSDTPLCNERVIRLRYRRGDKDWVKSRLEALIDNPGSDDEFHFAEDFYARKFKKKRTSELTDILRAGETILIDEAFKGRPEQAALSFYRSRGQLAFMTENEIWRQLFGLLFWDELYGREGASLHNSFERLPVALKTGHFYDQFRGEIDARLEELADTSRTLMHVLKMTSRHYGMPNGVFFWDSDAIERIKLLLLHADPQALASILRLMARDYSNTKNGFPDLMLIDDDALRFVEIKSEGDVIRRNQLTRIKQMRAAGLRTDIVRIDWAVDPQQVYVVVDIETTGGRAANHRITEIGAVKVQNGEVIAEWQSLINPQRPVPAMITRLTGISSDMVADAPLFAEIADEFEAFMGGAIFVAHNVGFDYGFLSAEYARLGRYFRYPKLCTVAAMRKYYPGYKSYSLKNMCDVFSINLDSHHRALCDARAAAELLKLVNHKRLA